MAGRLPAAMLVACVAVVGAARCGSSTQPSAFISITGTTVLTALGQTSQLAAKTNTGVDVTGQVTWQSMNTAVATVSLSGLVTAAGFGATSITGVYQGAKTSLAISVVNPAATQVLNACGTIAVPGMYILSSDLPANPTTGSCVTVAGVSAVHVDCQGHSLVSVNLSNVSDVTLSNCSLGSVTGNMLTDVTIGHSSATSVTLASSTRLTLMSNHVVVDGISLTNAVSAVVATNALDGLRASGTFWAIGLSGGHNNQVTSNTLDGGYDGSVMESGIDDGILLTNEDGDLVRGNSITNFWDTAVESIDQLTNTTIADNTFSMIGTSAIGAYWCTNWTANSLQGNSVASSPRLLRVIRDVGPQCGSAAAAPGFSANRISENNFRNPVIGLGTADVARLVIIMDSAPAGAVQSNLIQDNNFGLENGPFVLPLSGFINGGGNVCGPLVDGVSNMACVGGQLRLRLLTADGLPNGRRGAIIPRPPFSAKRVGSQVAEPSGRREDVSDAEFLAQSQRRE